MVEEVTKNDVEIINVAKDKNTIYKAKEKEIINQLKEKELKRKIEYINNNVGLCTLIVTILIGVSSVLFKGFIYVYTCGKYDYLGISHTYINISNENILYEVFFVITFGIIYIAFNIPLFFILTSNTRWNKKIFKGIRVLFVTTIIFFIVSFWYYIIYKQGFQVSDISWKLLSSKVFWNYLFLMLMVSILAHVGGVIFSIIYLLEKPINRKDISNKEDKVTMLWHKIICVPRLMVVIVGLALYILLFYYYGRENCSNERKYKMIDDNHVIVFENKTNFLISECIIDEKNNTLTIKKGIQKLISKEDVATEAKVFNKVTVS